MSNKELKTIRIGGEILNSITITKENSCEFNYRYSQFNIKKIELFFKNVKGFSFANIFNILCILLFSDLFPRC